MRFKEIEDSELKSVNDKELIELYKEAQIWLQEGYDYDKKDGQAEKLVEKLIDIEDEIQERDIPLRPRHFCVQCKKFWNNDRYCPHGFDEDELWKIYKKAAFGKIRLTSSPGYKKIEFWDKEDNFVGKYYESENQ